ncbi:MAG: hypothetical protein ABI647_08780 [Gemmatimonadota bacterium]
MAKMWADWLGDRLSATRTIPREIVEDEFRLIIDVFQTMVGPLRRETRTIWKKVTEEYGRRAALRGLAAGEVVEEMQYLRELLIRHLAPAIAALRPRQGMALLLRLNRLVDHGVARAVVGYTDALIQTMLPSEDTGPSPALADASATRERFKNIRIELAQIIAAPGNNVAPLL